MNDGTGDYDWALKRGLITTANVSDTDIAKLSIAKTSSKEILRIDPQGIVRRNGQPIEELDAPELLQIVRELLAMIQKG